MSRRAEASVGIEEVVGSELYGRFISRFAKSIYRIIETLNEGLNVVDGDPAIVDVLQKMGYASMLPYSVKGEIGFVKTESFDEFYQRFKQTTFFKDVEKKVGRKEDTVPPS
ncbi:hypothetical protein HYW21_09090 [Candidatus Woesearchaeota archaeon]|nr:hypothetical protein [Candidatus Woesearchaeota archaeon]